MDELTEYHRQLMAEIQGDADAMGLITSEAFLEKSSPARHSSKRLRMCWTKPVR